MTWVLIGEAARKAFENGQWPDWIAEAFGVAVTVSGFALFVVFGGAISLYNWTETFKVPAVWLVLVTPLIAFLLPVPVVMRLVGLVTAALAMLFVGVWAYLRRM